MPSNNVKYSQELREQTSKLIIESGRSATSVAEEMGIDTNTVCRWVRDYRRQNKMPSWSEERGISSLRPSKEDRELSRRNKELEKELKRERKLRMEETEKVEILKKSLHIFMQLPE